MRILLHGATNGTNFGDCLFSVLFYRKLAERFGKESVSFYDRWPFGIGKHLRKTLRYTKRLTLSDYRGVDVFVYISGGYFGDGAKSLKNSSIRFVRYLLPGLVAVKRGVPLHVIGLEIGPLHHWFVRKAVSIILASSVLTIARNQESKEYAEQLGVSDVICSADTAISLQKSDFYGYASEGIKLFVSRLTKKVVFLHLLPHDSVDGEFMSKLIQPLIRYMNEHDEYCVVYGTDGGQRKRDFAQLGAVFSKQGIEHYYLDYTNVYDMCYFLDSTSLILTRKLHVGIVGAVFGKAVISTPIHMHKTVRFYKQIGEEDRCVPYGMLKGDTLYDLLNRYGENQISIPRELTEQAESNIKHLMDDLQKME